MLLQVGFKSLGYEMQEEKPAYDSISLLGETNMVLLTTGIEQWKYDSVAMSQWVFKNSELKFSALDREIVQTCRP